jgi:hypothetical protein
VLEHVHNHYGRKFMGPMGALLSRGLRLVFFIGKAHEDDGNVVVVVVVVVVFFGVFEP